MRLDWSGFVHHSLFSLALFNKVNKRNSCSAKWRIIWAWDPPTAFSISARLLLRTRVCGGQAAA